jgi:hypothetical protein
MRPTADVNWLCATIEAIKPYFQWPRPYSLIARQLLEDLSRECLCPGSALRRRLRLEHPDLNPGIAREGDIQIFPSPSLYLFLKLSLILTLSFLFLSFPFFKYI